MSKMDFVAQTQESESFCPIYLDIDTTIEGTLSSVKKNLENNSLSKKTKAMEEILLMHLKGEDVSSLFMDIIRFAVPSTDHRMKRLVYLFFQTFNMCKKDGTPRDEVILVCNALRNDLCSPNEYVRGSVLRLLSRLTIFNIIQPLIPSIVDNVEHREPYVYRNALLCLTNISEQFGSDLVTSSFSTVERFITTCDDVFGTVRAYKLLESCNLDLCIQFILAVEANLLNLSPLIHLALLGSFEKLSSVNEQIAQMMLRILTILLQFSNNNSVLFYSANLFLKYHQNYTKNVEDVNVCCKCLIKVLLNESDLNVKMTVLDKLKMIHNKSRSMKLPNLLEDFVNDLLKGLSVTNLVVTSKLLSLVLGLATKSNVDVILESLLRSFVKVNSNYSSEEVVKYRSLILETLFNLTKSFSSQLLNVSNNLLVYLTEEDEVLSTQISLLLYEIINQLYSNTTNQPEVNDKVQKLLDDMINQVDDIFFKDVLSNCLYIIGEFSNNYDFIQTVYQFLFSSKETESEITDKKSVYNVILEDGSYSTTYSNFGNTKKGDQEERGFHNMLTNNKDILLYNTLATTLLKLLYRYLTETSKDEDKDSKNYVEFTSLVVIKLIESLDKDVYYVKTLKMVLSLLLGLLKERPKYLNLVNTYLKLTKSTEPTTKEEEEDYRLFKLEFDLNDFFTNVTSNKEEEDEDDETKLTSDLSTYSKIHQFTSLTDPIYVEGYIKLIGNKLYFNLFIENKSDEVLQNISLDLSTGTNMQLATNRKMITLLPKQSTSMQVKFRVETSNDETVYGYVYYSTSNTILLQCLSFNPIHVSMYDFITPTKISSQLFRTYWNDFQWENVIRLNDIKVEPKQLLKNIIKLTNMSIINPNTSHDHFGYNSLLQNELDNDKSSENSSKDLDDTDYNLLNDSFLSVNLFLKTIFDEEAIANLSLVKKPNNTYSGCFRIRSRGQNVAVGLGDRIALVTREIAI